MWKSLRQKYCRHTISVEMVLVNSTLPFFTALHLKRNRQSRIPHFLYQVRAFQPSLGSFNHELVGVQRTSILG